MENNNDNKVLNVPHLRFPEFSEEWEICKVSELLDFYSTNSLSWEQLEYGTKAMMNLHYGLIHVGLPTMVDLTRDNLPNIKEDNMPKNFELCKEGDVAFADASEDTNEVAKPIEFFDLAGKNIVCGLHTIHGRDNKNKTVIGFKGYAFSSSAFHNQIRRIAQGTKIYSISTKNFSECFIGIPSKVEQTKIATLLRLIDERIATQNKIIEDLKKLKSAIIEKEYTHKTKSNSHIGDFIEQTSKRNKNRAIQNVLSVSNRQGFIQQSEQFENRSVASDDTSSYKIVKKNNFAFNPARINVGSIARLTTFDRGIVSPMYICFRTKDTLFPEYLDYYFETKQFFTEIQKRLEGSVRQCLSFEGLCNIPLCIPTIEVQQQVGKQLSTLVQEIKLEIDFLELLQRQKKFLLHQMFI
ncbi:restriction endonuclease subunit S [Bacteroides xylanisolvens]|uniref:Restriction endonuclease subunit S n=3 Tax=Bacteroides TaxID=816 RepID=A0A7J5QLE3_9BACE|nr:restriction endonuclease subunit S [Bacteroides xylanisolvens]KAB6391510.1 restriction endonuclease subunit S [Bacteroides xylanisolvens]KAB6418799.1 restriction endonuclease subunit S [Bacteroides xylanisolvens]KAB6427940.1 restriction endonuclease subunit S [Bacteroides xylanisolvens]